jgi:hypothetical protein
LKNTSTKHNKFVFNQKLEHVEEISFRELFGNIEKLLHVSLIIISFGHETNRFWSRDIRTDINAQCSYKGLQWK